jgi:hypothetical protein
MTVCTKSPAQQGHRCYRHSTRIRFGVKIYTRSRSSTSWLGPFHAKNQENLLSLWFLDNKSSSSKGSRAPSPPPPPQAKSPFETGPRGSIPSWLVLYTLPGATEARGLASMENGGRTLGMLEVEAVAVADSEVPLRLYFYSF